MKADVAIKATDIEIYNSSGELIIKGNRTGSVFSNTTLSDIDSGASDYLYGLTFDASNIVKLQANNQFFANTY